MNAFYASDKNLTALKNCFYAAVCLILAVASTSCQSPIESDTPRSLTPDVQWKNDLLSTGVATIQGQEPEVKLQMQRAIGVTDGNVYVSASLIGSFTPTSDLAKLPSVSGAMTLGGAASTFQHIGNGVLAGFFGNPPLPNGAVNATVSIDGFSLTEGVIAVPEERKLASHTENQIFDINKDLTLTLNKPAEQGMETEALLFAGGYYSYGLVLKTFPAGSASVQIASADIKNYINKVPASFENWEYKGVKGNIPITVVVRVKGAKSANSGKVSLAGVTTYTMNLVTRK